MTSYSDITSYLRTCQFHQKMSSFKVFQCKISSRMRYWRTFYDNFENFRNLNFQWEVTIKSSQYLLLIAGFDQNEGDIRDRWWKLIDIKWWPSWFWKKKIYLAHESFVTWLHLSQFNNLFQIQQCNLIHSLHCLNT